MGLFGWCLFLALSRRPTRERGQEKGFKCKEKVRVSYCRKDGVLGSGEGIGSLGKGIRELLLKGGCGGLVGQPRQESVLERQEWDNEGGRGFPELSDTKSTADHMWEFWRKRLRASHRRGGDTGDGCSLSCVLLFAAPWAIAHQAPLSMGFSRQEYWVGYHSVLQGIFLTLGWNLCFFSALVGGFFTHWATWGWKEMASGVLALLGCHCIFPELSLHIPPAQHSWPSPPACAWDPWRV